MYLTLNNGLFNRGTKRADKNLQVDVDVLDDKDQVLDVCVLTYIVYVHAAHLNIHVCVCVLMYYTEQEHRHTSVGINELYELSVALEWTILAKFTLLGVYVLMLGKGSLGLSVPPSTPDTHMQC